MTKKHYTAIAAILKSHDSSQDYYEQISYESLCKDLAGYFATDNKNFNRAMFLTECDILPSSQK